MLENNERYPLENLLVEDLLSSNKLIALLLVLQHQALQDEYRNLQLQEATEGDSTRVESIAIRTLKMKRVEGDQEVVILE